jgi:uncharacterized CHY-type Zn-finger protein
MAKKSDKIQPVPSKIEIHILRCSNCSERLKALPYLGVAECPNCHTRYEYRGEDGWYCQLGK